jgi:putative transposase
VVSKGYKFRFYPNSAQKKQLAQDFGCARHVWNHALESRTKAYQERGERLTGVDISREITSLASLPVKSGTRRNGMAARCLK